MVSHLEAAFKSARGNALMQHFASIRGLVTLFARHGEGVALGFNGHIGRAKAGNRHSDAVFIVADALNVIGRISLGFAGRSFIQKLEQAVKANRGTIEGGEIKHVIFS
jgi:hypothetical protein